MSPPLHFFFTSFTACFRGKICDDTFRLKRTNIKYLSRHQTVNNVACRLQPGKSFDRCCVFQRHLWEAESLMLRPLSMLPCRCADHLLDFGCAFPTSKTARGCLLLPPDGALVSRELMEGVVGSRTGRLPVGDCWRTWVATCFIAEHQACVIWPRIRITARKAEHASAAGKVWSAQVIY